MIRNNQQSARFVAEQRLRYRQLDDPCDEQCGCSYVERYGPESLVSDREFDRKCRQMCRKQKHYNLCDEQCGCSYIERYGPEALVSDEEYDRKCRYCHCGHIR